MKRTFTMIITAAFCIAVMASCGGNTANNVTDNTNTTAAITSAASVTTVAATEPTTAQLTTAATSNLEKKSEAASTAKVTTAKTTAKKTAAATKKAAPKTTAKKVSSNSNSKKNYEKWTTYDFGEKGTYEIYQKSDGTWVCKYSDAHSSSEDFGKSKSDVDPRVPKKTSIPKNIPVKHSIDFYSKGTWSDYTIYGDAKCHTLSYDDLKWIADKANEWIKNDLALYCKNKGKNVYYDSDALSWDTYWNYVPNKECGLEKAKAELSYLWQDPVNANGHCGLRVSVETPKQQKKRWGSDLLSDYPDNEYILFFNWS